MITFPQTVTLAAGAVTWLCGVALVKNVPLFRKYNLPAPVIGGILFAAIFAAMKSLGIDPPKFDTRLVPPLMIAFFSSLGFGASVRELKKGGKAVIYLLIAASGLLILQVIVGAIIARSIGQVPLFGVLTSAVSLVGGPGTALSFASEFESHGVSSAATIGVAAAMLGIVIGGLLGAPLSTLIIGRQHEKAEAEARAHPLAAVLPVIEVPEEPEAPVPVDKIAAHLIYHLAWILIIGSIGFYLSKWIGAQGITLPFYVGSMVIAFIVRNVDERYGWLKLDKYWIDAIGSTCLVLFVSVSMMTLELWTIATVVGPLAIVLLLQTVLVCLFSVVVVYRLMGKDYDAAVMSGGMIGFMLGTTANAMATMSALTQRFGPAPRAFLVIPLVGACFIDFVNALVISIALSFL